MYLLLVIYQHDLDTGDIGLAAVGIDNLGRCGDLFLARVLEETVQGDLRGINRPGDGRPRALMATSEAPLLNWVTTAST
jgi:hypothetical protein